MNPKKKTQDVLIRESRIRARQANEAEQEARAVSPEALAKKFAEFEGIEVAERRLANPDIWHSVAQRLVDEPSFGEDPHGLRARWALRWINTATPNRYSHVIGNLGYVPVPWEELRDADKLAGAFHDGPFVRRGDKGVELLVKMPKELFVAIKARQREVARQASTPEGLQRAAQADAAARGADAGAIVGTIKAGAPETLTAENS
jgi:hypothetical protein